MSTPTQPSSSGGGRRSSGDKRVTSPSSGSVTTRNGARQAKIQTRAMATAKKPVSASAAVIAHKRKAMQKKKSCIDTVLRDHYQTAMDAKNFVRGATGLTTDHRMIDHRCLWDPNYPECPERLSSVIQRCEELGLISQCKQIGSRMATPEEVNSLHSPTVHNLMQTTHNSNDYVALEEISSRYDAVYIHPTTHELALLSAGSTIDIVEAIVQGEIQNGAAFVRPPGHHAMKAEPCGYCFYNNVALAAKHALDSLGVNRILIVDWDVHHGQATQQMFYDDPRVVYFSIHRYEHGSFWPNLRQSNFNYVGAGAGKGFNFNVPLNETGMGDGDYLAIWHQLLLPMAFEGEMEVTPACYAHLTHALLAVCPRVCVVLEGGYCLQSLAEGAALTLRTLLGRAPPQLHALAPPCHAIVETILNCIYAHKPYWRCYNAQPTYSTDSVPNVCDGVKEKHTVLVKWEGDETRAERFATRDCYPMQSKDFLDNVKSKLNQLQIVTDLTVPQHQVCYVYDEAMLKHKNICEPGHVECPERVLRIHERLRDYGLLARLHRLPPRRAADEEILLVHSAGHLARLKELSSTKLRDLNQMKERYDSVYFHPDSLESATVAAGCVLQVLDSVVSGESGAGACVVRPPGHHADDDTPAGFCLLNNAAIAARTATHCHGLRRVLLLDWDVHHGNGTQKIFESDPCVLYVSLHRYDNGSFFPHSKNADYTSVGVGRGEGFNVNIPWNKRGMGDAEYLAAFTNIVLPIAYEYDPQLVIVSAGFDACVGDPLGGCKVSPECYGRLTQMLRTLAQGQVILCLEGGYNTTSISYAMTMCTKALLGDPLPHYYEPKQTCHWSAVESINNVITVHKKYWKNLKFQVALPVEDVLGEPIPSRGLFVQDNDKLEISGYSSASTLNDTAKTDQSNTTLEVPANESLENYMSNMQLTKDEKRVSGQNSTSSLCEKRVTRSSSKTMSPVKIEIEGLESGDTFEHKDDSDAPVRVTKSASKSPQKTLLKNDSGVDTDLIVDSPIAAMCEKRMTRSRSNGAQEISLEKSKCTDGNCGTDDEEEPSKSNDTSKPGSSSGFTNEPSSSNANTPETLVDYLSANMNAILNEEMFAVVPQRWCPHLDSLEVIPESVKFEQGVKCANCDHTEENWVCLHCYVVACSRAVNGHMQEHFRESRHPLVLSLLDLSAWCNECDAYVDNSLLYDAKNLAHRAKFGEDMPWIYSTSVHME